MLSAIAVHFRRWAVCASCISTQICIIAGYFRFFTPDSDHTGVHMNRTPNHLFKWTRVHKTRTNWTVWPSVLWSGPSSLMWPRLESALWVSWPWVLASRAWHRVLIINIWIHSRWMKHSSANTCAWECSVTTGCVVVCLLGTSVHTHIYPTVSQCLLHG